MEFILENTSIFDQDVFIKFDSLIKSNLSIFNKNVYYDLTVSFDVEIYNSNLEERNKELFNEVSEDIERKERIQKVLSIQLDKIHKLLKEIGIELTLLDVHGDHLHQKNIVKIDIKENGREIKYTKSGKKKPQMGFKIATFDNYVFRERFLKSISDIEIQIWHEYQIEIMNGETLTYEEYLHKRKTPNKVML